MSRYEEAVRKRWSAAQAEHRAEPLTFADVCDISAIAERVEQLERERDAAEEALVAAREREAELVEAGKNLIAVARLTPPPGEIICFKQITAMEAAIDHAEASRKEGE